MKKALFFSLPFIVAAMASCSLGKSRTVSVANPVPDKPIENNINIMAQRLADLDIDVKEISEQGDSVRITFKGDATDSVVRAILAPAGRLSFTKVVDPSESLVEVAARTIKSNNPKYADVFGEIGTDYKYTYFRAPNFNASTIDSLLKDMRQPMNIPDNYKLKWGKTVIPNGEELNVLYVLDTYNSIDGVSLVDVTVEHEEMMGSFCTITLSDEGSRQFARLTRNCIGQGVALIIDNQVVMTPVVNDEITGGRVQITGNFTAEEMKSLATVLKNPYVR